MDLFIETPRQVSERMEREQRAQDDRRGALQGVPDIAERAAGLAGRCRSRQVGASAARLAPIRMSRLVPGARRDSRRLPRRAPDA